MSLAALWMLVSMFAQTSVPAPPAADTAAPDAFVMGVLRRDGLVSPFAAFEKKNWKSPWPAGLEYLDLPISMEAIPRSWWGKAGMPAAMTIWVDGAQQGTLALTRPARVRVMCSPRLALASDYRSKEPAPPPGVQPYPKDGLVISNGQPIDAIETLSPTSPEWVPTAVMLVDPFDGLEREAIARFSEWKHPVSRAERRKVPVELETLYRAPTDTPGWTAYHIEAIKRYPPGPGDDDCGVLTYLTGWLLAGPDGRQRLQLGAQISYCDRQNNTYMLPLGLIRRDGKSYWVYQISGYEREGYAVVRPTPKMNEPEVMYTAGLCSR